MEKTCPVVGVITLLSKKWNLLILKLLNEHDKKRFNELMVEVSGVSSRTLSKRLKELEAAKLIKKNKFNEIPPRVEYSLTTSGKDLIYCFKYLNEWVMKYK